MYAPNSLLVFTLKSSCLLHEGCVWLVLNLDTFLDSNGDTHCLLLFSAQAMDKLAHVYDQRVKQVSEQHEADEHGQFRDWFNKRAEVSAVIDLHLHMCKCVEVEV